MSTEKPAEKKSASREKSIIGKRMFLLILSLSLVLCAAGAVFGMILFYRSTRRAYARAAYYLSFGMSDLVYAGEVKDEIVPEFVEIYRSVPEEQIKPSYEYYSLFDSIENHPANRSMEKNLASFSEETQVSAMYLTLYDLKKERLVFIMDSRTGEDHEPPGAMIDVPLGDVFRDYTKDSVAHIPYLQFNTRKYGQTIACWTVADEIDQDYMIMVMVEMDMSNIMNKGLIFLGQYLLAALALALFLDTLIVYIVRKRVVTPLMDMSEAAKEFAVIKGNDSEEYVFEKLDIHTGDEIEGLSNTLKDMEKERVENLNSLMSLTKEKEHLSAELGVAANIQNDALPTDFPNRDEFEIYAVMDPAKEVGGDFYNFVMLDDDHIIMTMADVSGRGIPGALFMMTCKTIIDNLSQVYPDDPAAILTGLNSQITQNNTADMFVTVWLGILELSSGRMICCNAGHEYPCVCRSGADFELIKDKHGLAAGAFETAKYTNYELQLSPGDCVFVYTDGVPESNDTEEKLYGTDRMVKALNHEREANMKTLLLKVLTSLKEFSAGTEQFDDITMLGIRYYGIQDEPQNDNEEQ